MAAMLNSLPTKERLGSIYESMPTKEQLIAAYTDGELRADLVQSTLSAAGADAFLSESQRSALTGLVKDGETADLIKEAALYYPTLSEKYHDYAPLVADAKEAVAARVVLARSAEGRSELIAEGKDLATEKLIAPVKEMAAEKIFAPAKARAAPFLTKVADKKASLVEKKEAILADKRLCRALEALQEAREHPTETAAALKATAISLLQYDKVAEYREYIQSDAFAEDTRQLVTESLPALAKDAAEQGLEKVRVKATALSSDLQSSVELLISSLSQPSGFETPDLSTTIERALSLAVQARSLLSDVTLHAARLSKNTASSRAALEKLAALIAPPANPEAVTAMTETAEATLATTNETDTNETDTNETDTDSLVTVDAGAGHTEVIS
ncbi:hypothetical protein EMIHUDRAFT_447715 [Emiliania huxleyi CCMP1516]|uniref:Uncharacterized protein n=2 Tax=Emiliania huxleyi TaxID=2903 RepID=A0A0D3JHB2_EMIH1|nr:hypothetical protein EMIHUDRAFT_447715 [Emiliania huxleyi CCMP1516]EOD22897.1 hypothetical protein EMIHUDRAFT_447715 [Emiliania huxleyi CCMP1516]|eukprot:XP_005775326.1 hypothetical protein EMIHUDRAFT_447715 [Emiliania huxleyi CCMP1516]